MKKLLFLPVVNVSRLSRGMVVLLLLGGAAVPGLAQQPASAPAATPQTGQLTGQVLDANTRQPVEFATVGLLPKNSDRPTTGTACDEQGRFVLSNVPPGEYTLSVSFVGYDNQRVEGIRVAAGAAPLALAPVLLAPATQQLKEVQVVGERELVEHRVDRIVYNADKDLTNAGGTAADVLQKAPLMTVDLEGNPQLRGSSNIRVLVNGKPSTLLTSNLAEALKQIPADQIKAVEVITSPSAKYDAEGTAGVVNIILKKNNLEGVNGNAGASISNRNAYLGGSLNRRRGKLGLNLNLGTNPFYNLARNETRRTDFLSDTLRSQLDQNGRFTNKGLGGFGQAGLDYDLTPKDLLTLGVQANTRGFTNDRALFTDYRLFRTAEGSGTTLRDAYNRDILTRDGSRNVDVNFGYTKTLPRPRQELSVLGLYSVNAGHTRYHLEQQRAGQPDYREASFNDNRNRELTLQTDYVHPLDSTRTLETGAKTILRRVASNYRIDADSLDGRGLLPVPARSNQFSYDQNVFAGYVAYGFALGNTWTIKAGTRLEHTRIDGDFQTTGLALHTSYTNLMPNLLAAWNFRPDHTLKLGYSRRIQRPGIFLLNPYINTSDRRNVSSGNPNVDAELTHAYELTYNTFVKKSSVTFSAYWNQTNNAIQSVARLVPGNTLLPTADTTRILFTTYQNLARNANYGLSAFGSTKLTPKWSLSGNVNLYYRQLTSPALGLSNGGGMFNLNLNSSWQLGNGWSAQFFGYFNSRRVELQGRTAGYRIYNLGVKREFWDKKANITIQAVNIFNRLLLFHNELESNRFTYENNTYFYNRQVRVSFNYRFGKMNNAPARPRKSIRNDDQKEAGGSGNG